MAIAATMRGVACLGSLLFRQAEPNQHIPYPLALTSIGCLAAKRHRGEGAQDARRSAGDSLWIAQGAGCPSAIDPASPRAPACRRGEPACRREAAARRREAAARRRRAIDPRLLADGLWRMGTADGRMGANPTRHPASSCASRAPCHQIPDHRAQKRQTAHRQATGRVQGRSAPRRARPPAVRGRLGPFRGRVGFGGCAGRRARRGAARSFHCGRPGR